MNDTVKKIVGLLEADSPELQVAAVQVLGELGLKEASVAKALEDCLIQGDERILGRFVLDAFAKIESAETIRALVRCLEKGDLVSEEAARLLAGMGTGAHTALAEVFTDADEVDKVRILGIFGRQISTESFGVLQEALVDPSLASHTWAALEPNLDQLSDVQLKSLMKQVTEMLGDEEANNSAASLTQGLRILGVLDGEGSRTTLVAHAADEQPIEVRRAALHALRGVKLTPTQTGTFLDAMKDPENKVLADEYRELLSTVDKWPAAQVPGLFELIESRQPEIRAFALQALRSTHTAEVAKLSMKYLHHADQDIAVAARDALGENPKSIELLLRSLQSDRNVDHCRVLAQVLVSLRESFPRNKMKTLTERAARNFTAGDPMGEILFGMLLAIDAEHTADLMVDKALRLRRSRKLKEALAVLARLARTDNLNPEGGYQLSVASLLVDAEALAKDPRGSGEGGVGSVSMGFLAQLVRDDFPVLERLKKESMLKPQMLLKVGSYFAETVGSERRFGAELLGWLAGRTTKDRTSEEARMLMRTEGL